MRIEAKHFWIRRGSEECLINVNAITSNQPMRARLSYFNQGEHGSTVGKSNCFCTLSRHCSYAQMSCIDEHSILVILGTPFNFSFFFYFLGRRELLQGVNSAHVNHIRTEY